MKKKAIIKKNKITKLNNKQPFLYKEINDHSSNYLYMQIKNGNKNSHRNKNNSKIKNLNSISNYNQKSISTNKYSFVNRNKVKNIKTLNDRRTQSQKSKNLSLDFSLLNPLNPINHKNKRNKITTINNNLTPYTNIREGTYIGFGKTTNITNVNKNNNSPNSFIKNNNNNNLNTTKGNISHLTNITFADERKLISNRNRSNKNARNKTPTFSRDNNLSIIHKHNPSDNHIIMNNSSLTNKNKNDNIEVIKFKKINNNKTIKNKNRINSVHNIFNKYKSIDNHRAFQPKNIFSQFKKKKIANYSYGFGINDIFCNNKNSNYTNGTLIENNKGLSLNNNNNNNEEQNIQNNNNNNNNVTKSKNSIKTNDTSVLQINLNSNLVSHGTSSTSNISANRFVNSSQNIQNRFNPKLNVNCHEININLSGIQKKEKECNTNNINISLINKDSNNSNIEKKWKGKKIKCMHDLCKTGLSGDEKKVNQDNFFIFKNFVKGFDNIYMGVCDGHGYYGHEVSGFIKENLPMNLNHALKKENLNLLTDDLSEVIKKCFLNENRHLLDNNQIDSKLSGTTCISVIYTPQKLIIANLGDSRCILGKYNNNKWVAENLSRDHKPTIKEEADRILKKGGRIRPMKDEDGEFIGPLRVYMKDREMPGLAMTRSFGDYFGSLAGTISEPEVTEHFLSQEDKFIIIASDGLFEFMESDEIVEIVKDYYEKNDIVGCCEFLYKESCKKWLDEEEDIIDDITVILVFFEDIFE